MFLLPILNDSFIKSIQVHNKALNIAVDGSYCVITLSKNKLKCSFFIIFNKNTVKICQVNFCAISCDILFYLISQHYAMSQYISVGHALYIGKEIYKAELSNTLNQIYIQL